MKRARCPQATDRTRIAWRRLTAIITRDDRRWLIAGSLLALLSAASGIGLLAVAGHFIAAMALAGAGGLAINYYTPAALIRLFAILRTGGRYAERLVTHAATLRVLARLRVWIFAKLIPLSPIQLQSLRSAELFSRLRADVDALEHAYLGVVVPIVVACGAAGLVCTIVLFYLPWLALMLACVLVVIGVLWPVWLHRRGDVAASATVETAETLRGLATDGFQGRAELALYGAEAAHAQRIASCARRRREAQRSVDALQAWGGAGVLLAMQITLALVFLAGIPALHEGMLAAPDLVMLTMLAMAVFETIGPLPDALAQWGATRRAAERVLALAGMQPLIRDPAALALPPLSVNVSIRQLRLRYNDEAPWVLKDLDLDLPAGRRIAWLGASGAGKTSLVAALLRWVDHEGSILLDGKPLGAYRTDDVRACFAVAEQQPYLFDASLRDNLCLGRPDATDARLRHAIDVAQLSAFVAALPQGLDTPLGENGMCISGGEVRRIAIARALLCDAPVLILDEPTEGLDAATADALLRALRKETAGRSVILITHRQRDLRLQVDEVFQLEGGHLSRVSTNALRPEKTLAEGPVLTSIA